jgi:predicted glycosyltransferase
MARSRSPRLLFYSHNGVGVGHVQRQLRLARAYARRHPGTGTLLVTGSHAVGSLRFPAGVDFVKLPSIRMVDRYRSWVPRDVDLTIEEVMRMRADLLRQSVKRFKPDLLVADFLPSGPYGELIPALEELGRRGGTALAGFRDIVDEPAFVRELWQETGVARALADHYAGSLVYGTKAVVDFASEYGLADGAESIHYVGYLGRRARPKLPPDCRAPFILATTGGGVDGGPLLRQFAAAAAQLRPRLGGTWLAVAGPLLPEDELALLAEEAERAGVTVARSLRRMGDLIAGADVVVGMSGYNTACELLSCSTPAVIVPRSGPSREQRLRADWLARWGRAEVLEPDGLQPAALGEAIERALARVAQKGERVDLGGVANALDLFDRAANGALAPGTAA